MSLKYDISGAQIDGARDYQEDSFLTSYLHAGDDGDQVALIIVADGMGGHAAGNVASNLAVQSFNKYVTTNYPANSIPTLLKVAMDEANKAIAKTIKETAALKGMGCTLVAALLINDKMYSISVGDSHLFHIQNNALTKKNADHSYGGYLDRMAADGNAVNEKNGYSRHMLLSALTGESIPAIDCPEQPVTLKDGDQILLCSDGIDTLDHKSIEAQCIEIKDAKELAKKLLREVELAEQPRQDNTTVLAAYITSTAPELTLSPVITPENTFATQQNTFTNSATQKPLEYAVGSNLDNRSNSSNLSWLIPALLITALGAGAWWFLNDNRAVIPEILREQKSEEIAHEVTEAPVLSEASSVDEGTDQKSTSTEITLFKDKLTKGGHAPEMVWIKAGSYEMGGTGNTPPVNERPRHKVTLDKFAIGSKEVTRGEFSRYSGIAVSNANKNQPIRDVSWKTAKKYTAWLSKQTGFTYRLPSEAEWEYTARAGTKSPYWWGYKIGVDNALCVGCTTPLEPSRPNDVGSYKANAFGLYDTAGNVAEWVEDCYHGNYEGAPTDGSAWITPDDCKERVIRGGSYFNATKSLFVSRRDKLAKKKAEKMIGFRIVREK